MELKTYLLQQGMTLSAFAEEIGVRTPSVSRYATGARIPRPAIMARIVAATGGAVTAQDFFDQATKGEAA